MSDCFSLPSVNCSKNAQNTSGALLVHPNVAQRDGTRMMAASGDQHRQKEENDRLLSQALSQLTFEERQKQQESVHGVIESVQEEEAYLQECLNELDQHLLKIKKGSVYEVAEIMDPEYVRSRKFRVMFLRGNRYGAKAAGDQMLRFFQIKQRLFGFNKLTKDITIEDLNDDDLATLRTGFVQILGRDRSNREIMINVPGLRSFKKLENELRCGFYLNMTALQESEDTQRFGFVVIVNNIGECKDAKRGEGWYESAELSKAIPHHLAAVHFLCNGIAEYVMANAALKVFNPGLRARFQVHLGSQLECQYILSTFGIVAELLPLVQGIGITNLQRHLQWVNDRSEQEVGGPVFPQPLGPSELISAPNPQDVVYIHGKTGNNPGNQYLRKLVKELSEAYSSGTNKQKRRLVDSMIATIFESGGRFLEEKEGPTWEKVTMDEARSKIMQSFRNHRHRLGLKPKLLDEAHLIVGEPLPDDVVFGRGPRSSGNELFTALIKAKSEEYEARDRGQKLPVVDGVIEKIKETGGRFLQPLPQAGTWMEVSPEEARMRVSKSFRNSRRKLKPKPK